MGLARRLEPGAAANLTGETGTYYYMAPEMFRHEVRARGSWILCPKPLDDIT